MAEATEKSAQDEIADVVSAELSGHVDQVIREHGELTIIIKRDSIIQVLRFLHDDKRT